jgi:Arc/MetJ-type ribon-helix-helix transcriptional regulator
VSKKESLEQFVSHQLQSGRFASYEALVRHALEVFQDSELELDQIAERLRAPFEALQRSEPGLDLDLEKVKREGRKRLRIISRAKGLAV